MEAWRHTRSLSEAAAGGVPEGPLRSNMNLPACWGCERMPFIKMPKPCWLGSAEGLGYGCHCCELPGNTVVCIFLGMFVKNQEKKGKGRTDTEG